MANSISELFDHSTLRHHVCGYSAYPAGKGIVTAVHSAKAGHPGGSLSAADIFTFLYFEEMKYPL